MLTPIRLFPRVALMAWHGTRHLVFPLRIWFVFVGLILVFAEAARDVSHKLRRRIGDQSKRRGCCDTRPSEYPRTGIGQLPELAKILEHRSGVGYVQYFDCTICGQGWVQLVGPEDQGKGLRTDVRKI